MCGSTVSVSASYARVPHPIASHRLDPGQVDLAPHWGLWVFQLLARAYDLGLGEARDEHGDVSVPNAVAAAELGGRGKEVVAVVEGHPEGSAGGQLVAAQDSPLGMWAWVSGCG